jgi:hypothetical protein
MLASDWSVRRRGKTLVPDPLEETWKESEIVSLLALDRAQEYGMVAVHIAVVPFLVAAIVALSKNVREVLTSNVLAFPLHVIVFPVGMIDAIVIVILKTILPVNVTFGWTPTSGRGSGLNAPVMGSR